MSQQIIDIVERVLAKAPQWIRQDLLAADPVTRRRAEEALAAMIGAAVEDQAPRADVISVAAS